MPGSGPTNQQSVGRLAVVALLVLTVRPAVVACCCCGRSLRLRVARPVCWSRFAAYHQADRPNAEQTVNGRCHSDNDRLAEKDDDRQGPTGRRTC